MGCLCVSYRFRTTRTQSIYGHVVAQFRACPAFEGATEGTEPARVALIRRLFLNLFFATNSFATAVLFCNLTVQ